MNDHRADRMAWIAVGLLTLVGLYLRTRSTAGQWPLWFDEAQTWQTAQSSWMEFATWRHHYEHAPLSFVLVRLSTMLVGTQAEGALRLPSLLAGLAAIPVSYSLARTAGPRSFGIALALLVTIDNILVDQSRQARMYSLLVLLSLLALQQLTRLAREPDVRRRWALLGVTLAAIFWTHALGLVLWLAFPIALLVATRDTPSHRRSILAGALVAYGTAIALSLPGFIARLNLLSPGTTSAGPAGWSALMETVGGMRYEIVHIYPGPVTGYFWIGLSALGFVLLARRAPVLATATGAFALMTVPLVAFTILGQSWGTDRYLVTFRLGMIVGLASLAAYAPWRAMRVAIQFLLLGLAIYVGSALAAPRVPRHHTLGIVSRALPDFLGEDDAVIYYKEWTRSVGAYYGIEPIQLRGDPPALPAGFDAATTWLVIGHVSPGDEGLREYLALLSDHYGVTYDSRKLNALLARYFSIAIQFQPDGTRYLMP